MTTDRDNAPEGTVRAFACELVSCHPHSRQWRLRVDRLYTESCERQVIERLETALAALKEEVATWSPWS
jgi:hypothetical protein